MERQHLRWGKADCGADVYSRKRALKQTMKEYTNILIGDLLNKYYILCLCVFWQLFGAGHITGYKIIYPLLAYCLDLTIFSWLFPIQPHLHTLMGNTAPPRGLASWNLTPGEWCGRVSGSLRKCSGPSHSSSTGTWTSPSWSSEAQRDSTGLGLHTQDSAVATVTGQQPPALSQAKHLDMLQIVSGWYIYIRFIQSAYMVYIKGKYLYIQGVSEWGSECIFSIYIDSGGDRWLTRDHTTTKH